MLKDILHRRAYAIQRMHANRINTVGNAVVSRKEAQLFSELVTMTDAGDVRVEMGESLRRAGK